MNLFYWSLLAFILGSSSLLAKPRLALLKFSGDEAIQATELEYLSTSFRLEMLRSGVFELVPEAMTIRILSEQKIQAKGFIDSETAIRAGKELDAEYILIGYVFPEKERQRIMTHVYRVNTGEVIRQQDTYYYPEAIQSLEKKVRETVVGINAIVVPKNHPASMNKLEKNRAFTLGLYYPGLGHFYVNRKLTGTIYSGLFTAALYNVFFLTPRMNRAHGDRILADARMYGLAALSLPPATSARENVGTALAGYFLAQRIRDERHDKVYPAQERTLTSIFFLATAYSIALADLSFVQLNLGSMPDGKSFGMTARYRF